MQSDTYTKVREFVIEWAKAQSMAEIAAKCGMTERQASNKAAALKRKGVLMKKMPFDKYMPNLSNNLTRDEYENLRRLSRGLPEKIILGKSKIKAVVGSCGVNCHEEFLSKLMQTKAANKHRNDIFFSDALAFWGTTKKTEIGNAISSVSKKLAEIENQAPVYCGNREVSAGEIRVLQHLHEWMQERFESQLRLMRAA